VAARHKTVDRNSRLSGFFNIVAEDLQMLSALHTREPDADLIQVLRDQQFPDGLGLKLTSERGREACEVVAEVLRVLPETMDQAALDDLAADYASIYLNHRIQASPEESVWIDEENLTHQDSMFQVRQWYARYGMAAPDWRTRPDDHLTLELEFIGRLLSEQVNQEQLREVGRFMDEHLLRWLMDFAERVAARCDTPYFAGMAMLTGVYCEELRDLIAEVLGEDRPSKEEIEERMQPRAQAENGVPVKFMPGMGPAV